MSKMSKDNKRIIEKSDLRDLDMIFSNAKTSMRSSSVYDMLNSEDFPINLHSKSHKSQINNIYRDLMIFNADELWKEK